ncbi:GNAT family N-acetyltransferase [Bacillus sp. V3-13]|uniref:GNAT family N-acetyltransferase n=1 Tax=Bacillus sp. V3-13 TaxID=2053728 RepID=UPI0015E12BAC|nr:GNAT family N-acetyltransferase [Bacillus sp. V3-13]
MQIEDFPAMARWLRTPVVLEFYGGVENPFTLEMIHEKYGPRVRGEIPVVPHIVQAGKEPIGFMQCYQTTTDDKREYGYQPDENIDLLKYYFYFSQSIAGPVIGYTRWKFLICLL